MVFVLQKHAIGVGHGVALNSLTNWERLTAGGVYFRPVRSWGNYNDGVDRIRQDGRLYQTGEQSTAWDWICYHLQYAYVSTTYCNGGRDGDVTIYTITNTPQTYARFNAHLVLPKISETSWRGRAAKLRIELLDLDAL